MGTVTEPGVATRPPLTAGHRYRRCLECPYWYGAEDDEYGPCSIKNARGDARFLTFGTWDCDEGFQEPAAAGPTGAAAPRAPATDDGRTERGRT